MEGVYELFRLWNGRLVSRPKPLCAPRAHKERTNCAFFAITPLLTTLAFLVGGRGVSPLPKKPHCIFPLNRVATSDSVGETAFELPYARARLFRWRLFGQSKHVGGLK